MNKKIINNRLIMCLLLASLSILSLFVGVNTLTIKQLMQADTLDWLILLSTRLPRTISIILAGATLSLSGLLMQQLTQNKFTSPSTTGTISSARLGLILALLFYPNASTLNRAIFAFVFAIVGTFMFTFLIDRIQAKNPIVVPIVGLMFGNVISSFGTYLALEWEIVQNVSAWLQGNFSLLHSSNFQLIYLSLISLAAIYFFSHYFSVMGLGKDLVTELGISFNNFRLIGIILIALGSASVLLTVGNIPFVGIVIPNLVSIRNGDHFKNNLFLVSTCGIIFLLVADILARMVIFPFEIPVSIIVGVLGSFLFLFLLFRGELT